MFASIPEVLDAIKSGEMVCVMDDENRENEGDLIMAAEFATGKHLGLLIRYTSGIVCVPMTSEQADKLELPLMVVRNEDQKQTNFTVTCDFKGARTGVSGEERAQTIRALASELTTPAMLTRPGHVFPLIARPGGVLEREGHTEAAVDLCKLAGLKPVAVIGELTNDDGTMMRLDDCEKFCKENKVLLTCIEHLIEYRKTAELDEAESSSS